jgi:transcriptional regulator with XRE-family HTH domain
VIGRNVDRLRKECGWSFDDLAQRTGIDRSLILGHVNKGKGMHPRTLRIYADAFTKQGHPVTVAELEA